MVCILVSSRSYENQEDPTIDGSVGTRHVLGCSFADIYSHGSTFKGTIGDKFSLSTTIMFAIANALALAIAAAALIVVINGAAYLYYRYFVRPVSKL